MCECKESDCLCKTCKEIGCFSCEVCRLRRLPVTSCEEYIGDGVAL